MDRAVQRKEISESVDQKSYLSIRSSDFLEWMHGLDRIGVTHDRFGSPPLILKDIRERLFNEALHVNTDNYGIADGPQLASPGHGLNKPARPAYPRNM